MVEYGTTWHPVTVTNATGGQKRWVVCVFWKVCRESREESTLSHAPLWCLVTSVNDMTHEVCDEGLQLVCGEVQDEEILLRLATALLRQEEKTGGMISPPGRFQLKRLEKGLVLLSNPPNSLDLRMLRSMGFKSVLNLAEPADKIEQSKGKELVEAAGLKYRSKRALNPATADCSRLICTT